MAKDNNFSSKCVEWLLPLVNPLYHYEGDLFVSEGAALNNTVYIITGGISLVNLE